MHIDEYNFCKPLLANEGRRIEVEITLRLAKWFGYDLGCRLTRRGEKN